MEIRIRKSNTHLIIILERDTKENEEEALIDKLIRIFQNWWKVGIHRFVKYSVIWAG